MRVDYRLKEKCKWSVGRPIEFRYVDIFIHDHAGGGEHQTLELPEPAAIELVDRMSASASVPSDGRPASASAGLALSPDGGDQDG